MDNRPIGMFDSGVGGMTVFREVAKGLPNESIIYIGDTASFPYGSKSKETIVELSKRQVENLIQKDAKLIIIACGTATSQALIEMRKMFNIPIIGIIESTVKYIKEKNYKKIGVIATTGTIRSKGWQTAIENDIEDCSVQSKACPLLAPMAEEGWIENDIAKLTIHEYIKDFKDIDTLVLGCTHYPLFEKFIINELEAGVDVINTGKMVSTYVNNFLIQNKMQHDLSCKPTYEIYLTDTESNFLNVASKLLQNDMITNNIKKI